MNVANMLPLKNSDLMRLLISLQHEKQKLLFWQRCEAGQRRHLHSAKILFINNDEKEIILTPEDKSFSLNESQFVYVFEKERKIIFKSKLKSIEEFRLSLETPKTIMITNTRKDERVHLLGQRIFLKFTHENKEEKHSLHRSEIIDMSPNGLSFKAQSFNDYGFQVGDPIWMKLDDNKELVKGEVRHLTLTKHGLHESFVQIGVMLTP